MASDVLLERMRVQFFSVQLPDSIIYLKQQSATELLRRFRAFVKWYVVWRKEQSGPFPYPNSMLTSPLFSVGNLSNHNSTLWEKGILFLLT